MAEMKWVKWSQWADGSITNFGQMPICDVNKNLQRFEQEAQKLLNTSGADHVVYGIKFFNENCELESVRFYLYPMGDEAFQKDIATLSGCTVYALHKR